jgi:hypothetical protein
MALKKLMEIFENASQTQVQMPQEFAVVFNTLNAREDRYETNSRAFCGPILPDLGMEMYDGDKRLDETKRFRISLPSSAFNLRRGASGTSSMFITKSGVFIGVYGQSTVDNLHPETEDKWATTVPLWMIQDIKRSSLANQ